MTVHINPTTIFSVPHSGLFVLYSLGSGISVHELSEPNISDTGCIVAHQMHSRIKNRTNNATIKNEPSIPSTRFPNDSGSKQVIFGSHKRLNVSKSPLVNADSNCSVTFMISCSLAKKFFNLHLKKKIKFIFSEKFFLPEEKENSSNLTIISSPDFCLYIQCLTKRKSVKVIWISFQAGLLLGPLDLNIEKCLLKAINTIKNVLGSVFAFKQIQKYKNTIAFFGEIEDKRTEKNAKKANSGQLRMDQSPSFQSNNFELKFNLVTN
ncbi:hypothetical protein BpHYR1_032265 [Brachionus plicatilis]|uniref:Uncharacterized protein n=1 Tax=Brachionus plicatilis TaxID=10195 RepID=A0A3M7SP06_BRAPC|nr:hypothetical protein BpHYR1_032265 [Brachionus plicatilis]